MSKDAENKKLHAKLERQVSETLVHMNRRGHVNRELEVLLEGHLRRVRSGEITEYVGVGSGVKGSHYLYIGNSPSRLLVLLYRLAARLHCLPRRACND